MWAANPKCTNAEIRAALQKSAGDLGYAQGRDEDTGFGLADAGAALAYLAKNKCRAYLPPSPPPKKLSPPPKKLSPPPKKPSPPPKKAPATPPVALWAQCGGKGGNCNNAAGECRDAAVKRECAQALSAAGWLFNPWPGQASWSTVPPAPYTIIYLSCNTAGGSNLLKRQRADCNRIHTVAHLPTCPPAHLHRRSTAEHGRLPCPRNAAACVAGAKCVRVDNSQL